MVGTMAKKVIGDGGSGKEGRNNMKENRKHKEKNIERLREEKEARKLKYLNSN